MSQEKVDRYKERKRNRKAIEAKKKREVLLTKLCAGVLVLALVGWIGYSAVDKYNEKQNTSTISADITALDEYAAELDAAE